MRKQNSVHKTGNPAYSSKTNLRLRNSSRFSLDSPVFYLEKDKLATRLM